MPLFLYHSRGILDDEGYFMFMGKSILRGAHPYINYADNKPPGIWYLLAFVFKVFGNSIYITRAILYLINALSALVLYLVGKEIWNEKIGRVSALIFLIGMLIPAFDGYYVLTEPFMNLFSLLGLLLFIRANKRTLYLAASGVAMGISILFKQTAILLLIAMIVFYLCKIWIPANRNKKYFGASARNVLLLLCGFVVPLIPVASYFWSIGALGQMVYYTTMSLKGFGSTINYSSLVSDFESFSIVWLLSFASLLAIGYKFIQKNIDREIFVGIWLLLSLFPLVLRQYGHYYIQVLPPVCLLASLFITNLIPFLIPFKEIFRQHDYVRLFTLVTIIVFVCFSIVLSVSEGYQMLTSDQPSYTINSFQNEMQTAFFIQSHTNTDDKILVYPYQPAIYFLSDRNPCTNLLFLQRPPIDEKTELKLLQQIIETSPKYLVWQTDTRGSITPGLPQIDAFLGSHFRKVQSIGNFDIYVNDDDQ